MLEAGVFHGVCEEEFFTRGCIKPPGNLRIVRGRTGRKNFCSGRPVPAAAAAYGRRCVYMTEGQKKEIKRLRESGAGYTAIAGKMGIPKETVRSFCRRNGLAGGAAKGRPEEGLAQDGVCRECGKPLQQTAGVKRRVFCSRCCFPD